MVEHVTQENLKKCEREKGKYFGPNAFASWTRERRPGKTPAMKIGVHSEKPEWEALGYESQEAMEEWRRQQVRKGQE